jgi:hypothetical protein
VYDESNALSRRLSKIELEIKALKKATDSASFPHTFCPLCAPDVNILVTDSQLADVQLIRSLPTLC